ncbi:MAG TPA: hypothetical protein VIS94_06250 [Desulfomonilia bacterium]
MKDNLERDHEKCWGIRIILDVLHNFSPLLGKPFTIITFMGEEKLFL